MRCRVRAAPAARAATENNPHDGALRRVRGRRAPRPRPRTPGIARDEGGFSLVELVVAMFLLAILALALLPLLIGAATVSGVNRSLVAATAFAEAQLAPLAVDYPSDSDTSSCAELRSMYARSGIVDPAAGDLRADMTVSACPDEGQYPAAIDVIVRVYPVSSPERALVTLPTKIVVAGP